MPISWARDQVEGFLGSVTSVVRNTSISDLLPPSVVSTIRWVANTLPMSLGFTDGPRKHIIGVAVVSAGMVLVSLGTLTPIGIVYFVLLMPISLLRLWPAVNDRWPLGPEDWPFWNLV